MRRKRGDAPSYIERDKNSPIPPLPSQPGTNKIAVDVVKAEERQEKALELLAKGWTTREIAKEMGVSKTSVLNWITTARLRRQMRTDNLFDMAFQQQIHRLEVLRKNLWKAAEKRTERIKTLIDPETGKPIRLIIEDREPNPQMFAQLVKVEQEIAKLLGLHGLPQDLTRTKDGLPTPVESDGMTVPIDSIVIPDGVTKGPEQKPVSVGVVVENPVSVEAQPPAAEETSSESKISGSSSDQGVPTAGEEPADSSNNEDALQNPSFS